MPENPGQQLEFLRREDIRTMAKDIARLREEESKKEHERIFSIQEEHKQKALGQVQQEQEPAKITLMPASPANTEAIAKELPRPLSKIKKFFVRIIVAFLLLFVVANVVALVYSFWKR